MSIMSTRPLAPSGFNATFMTLSRLMAEEIQRLVVEGKPMRQEPCEIDPAGVEHPHEAAHPVFPARPKGSAHFSRSAEGRITP